LAESDDAVLRYDTLLFDLDLTLFDFAGSERAAFEDCAQAAGFPDDPELFARYKVINNELWAQVEQGTLSPSEAGKQRFERLSGEFGAANSIDPGELGELFQVGLGRHGDLYPNVETTLNELSEHGALALVTNGLTSVQWAKVARLDLERWFTPIVISDEVGVAKPDPAIFDLVFAELGEDRRRSAVMIGDSLTSDMTGAQAAGIAACWYNPAEHDLPETPKIDHVVTQLTDLVHVLGR